MPPFSKLFNSFKKVTNRHAPLRTLSNRKAKQFSNLGLLWGYLNGSYLWYKGPGK